MPDDIRQSLLDEGLMDDYEGRPSYQQNDYLIWIAGARRPDTRVKRIRQMLDELRRGGVYMNVAHRPSAKS
jgi:uncharacterized protein YdeI (YjbR/CyaY-like superfamily)